MEKDNFSILMDVIFFQYESPKILTQIRIDFYGFNYPFIEWIGLKDMLIGDSPVYAK